MFQQTGAAEAKELPKTHSIPSDLLPKLSSMDFSIAHRNTSGHLRCQELEALLVKY